MPAAFGSRAALTDTLDDTEFLRHAGGRTPLFRDRSAANASGTNVRPRGREHTLVAEGVVVHSLFAPVNEPSSTSSTARESTREGSLIDMGVDQGLIHKNRVPGSPTGRALGQGRKPRNFLVENADVADEIEERSRKSLALVPW